MHVDYAFVAEAADSQAGLFYVTRGGPTSTRCPRLPEAAASRRGSRSSCGWRATSRTSGRPGSVRFVIVDADGHPIGFDQQAEARFERHPIDPTMSSANMMAFRFYGFPVPDFGAYGFEVHAGDERLARVPFWVVPAEGMSAPGDADPTGPAVTCRAPRRSPSGSGVPDEAEDPFGELLAPILLQEMRGALDDVGLADRRDQRGHRVRRAGAR